MTSITLTDKSFGRIETRFEDGNNQFERRVVVRITVEPSNGPRKAYGRVNGFGVGNISEDPADATRIVRVLFSNTLQVPYTH